MSVLGYQCCFCGLSIDETAAEPIVIRLGGKEYINDFDKEKQMMFSHIACLEQHLSPSTPFLAEIFEED